MTLQADPAELRRHYESYDTEELISRIRSGALEPEAVQIASTVLAARGVEAPSAGNDDDEAARKGPTGVGGWLLFLVVALIFLGPVATFVRLFLDFETTELRNPRITTLEQWDTLKSATYSTYAVTAGLCIYAGVGLVRRRDRTAVTLAKSTLWIAGPVAALVVGLLVPFVVFGTPGLLSELIVDLIKSALAPAIWTAYLSYSKRVRNTYLNSVAHDNP